ncbi:hypothetical protein [Actinoplanes sp. NPDC049316]|uniref:hypothetical protein n=1 Tax=Actinoplanes sp. NPDC049316 TaxID=3154727 RepID=UPI0034354785
MLLPEHAPAVGGDVSEQIGRLADPTPVEFVTVTVNVSPRTGAAATIAAISPVSSGSSASARLTELAHLDHRHALLAGRDVT